MNGQVCQGAPVNLNDLKDYNTFEIKPLEFKEFDTYEASKEGCIQEMNKLELKEACCMYTKYEY